MSWIVVAAEEELGVNEPLRVIVDGKPVVVVRTPSGVYALSDVCSHADVSLSDGEVVGDSIECFLHGSCFSLTTGQPSCLPAIDPVPVYPVRVSDGAVEVGTQPTTAARQGVS